MSGRPQTKDAPISFTQEEVDALTSGGKAAAKVRQRLRDQRQAARKSSKPITEKASPQPINRREMAAVLKRGAPSSVRRRIASSSPSSTEAEAYTPPVKAVPSATPGKQKY
jgi:hypothetical protein